MGLHIFKTLCFSMAFFQHYYYVFAQDSTFDFDSPRFRNIVSTSTFVDKTLLIKEIIVNNKTSLITAPPGFGKSTNQDILKSFFEIEVDEEGEPITNANYLIRPVKDTPNYKLFTDHGLRITKETKIMDEHFGRSPVMRVSFRCTRPIRNFDDAFRFLKEASHNAFKQYRYLSKSRFLSEAEREYYSIWCNDREYHMFGKHIVTFSLRELASFLSRHFSHRKVFVMIDDHDSLTKAAMLSVSSAEEFEAIVRFSVIMLHYVFKDHTRNVWGGLMTGVSPIPVFNSSNLNLVNPHDYHLYRFLGDHNYTNFYGLTKEEVESLLVQHKNNIGKDVNEQLITHYSGYQSSSGKNIYNLYSTMKFLQHGVIENYWTKYNTIPNFRNILKVPAVSKAVKTLLKGGTIHVPEVEDNLKYDDVLDYRNTLLRPEEQSSSVVMTFFHHLFEEGYLTQIDSQTNALKIPNDEAKAAFTEHIKP